MRCALLPVLLATLAACDPLPRDIEGTADHVRQSGTVRVGIVAGDADAGHARLIDAYLAQVERVVGARRQVTTGAAEPLLARLEHGDLDLVIGEFAKDSPWLPDVAMLDPLTHRIEADRTITLAPAARNGENRWIMTLEKLARDRNGR